jgi:ribose transport system permease protein
MKRVSLPTGLKWLTELTMLPVLVLLILAFSVFAPNMLSPLNITNVLSQSAVVAIAAIGATFVILTGGIDLSTGSSISASGVTAAAVMTATGNVALGIICGIVVGVLVGLIIGLLITHLNLVPFVVTLAGLFAIAGTALLLSNGATIAPIPSSITGFGIALVAGIPAPVVLAVVLFVVMQFLLTNTTWGRRVILVGANRQAAKISGIHVRRVETSVYAIAGFFSAIAGVLMTVNLYGANASMGSSQLLNVIGAVVLGGTSLFGGRGSVVRTAIGVLVLGFLANGMNLLGLSSYDQQAVTGAVIVIAACVDAILHRKRR